MKQQLQNCLLRPWRAGDERSLVAHANSRDIWLNLRDQFPHPYTQAHAEAWVAFASSAAQPTSLAIEVDSEAVGGISLKVNDDIERVSAEIGYWLGRRFWNRGIMTAAVRAVTAYGFERFSLTRVYAVPFVTNVASHRVLVKAGYVREGVLRRSAMKDGVVLDQVLFAITDHDQPPANVTVRRHQAWRDPIDGSITYCVADAGLRPPNLSASAYLLWEFDAASIEEAMSVHFVRLGYAPYHPSGDPAECPVCAAIYYPHGSGECWKCGRKE